MPSKVTRPTLADLCKEDVLVIVRDAVADLVREMDKRMPENAEVVRLARVEMAARKLFAALDYVTPDWREKTCVIDENSDEVNVAWCELEAAINGEKEYSGDELAF